MGTLGLKVRVNVTGLKKLRGYILSGVFGNSGPIRDAIRHWAVRYRAAMQERFYEYSRGGGDWAPLAPATLRGRRTPTRKALAQSTKRLSKAVVRLKKAKRSGNEKRVDKAIDNYAGAAAKFLITRRKRKEFLSGKNAAILIDTGLLVGALDPQFSNRPGQFQEDIPGGIVVGFGGPARYPKGKATIADIAAFHNFGGKGGRPPQRMILTDAPAKVVVGMVSDMRAALGRAAKLSEI